MAKILIKYPTRSRPKEFLDTLGKYISMASGKHELRIVVSAHNDDKTMATPEIQEAVNQYPGVSLHFSDATNKVENFNSFMDVVSDWDILLVVSDDMIPQVQGYDEIIAQEMEARFPDTDGCLFFNDGTEAVKRNLCTLSIMGRKYYDRFKYIYHPAYKSFFCDNEYTHVAQALGKMEYIDHCIIKHEHPFWGGSFVNDQLYQRSNQHWKHDENMYKRRTQANFEQSIPVPIDTSPRLAKAPTIGPHPILSILIPTIVGREESFNRLHSEVTKQAEPFGDQVEVLFEKDNRKITIGEKRNMLYARATGKYSVQIDDDDMVPPNYIETVLNALQHNPTHVGQLNQCVMNGVNKISCDSDRFDKWENNKYGYDYVRTIFYKNPIRTDIARAIPSKHINFGEDAQFSKDLKASGLLTKEVFINGIMYYYTWNSKRK